MSSSSPPPAPAVAPRGPARHAQALARVVFVGYAIALFTITHWPNMRVPEVVPRTDLWIHLFCFGLWTILLNCCALFAPVRSYANVGLCSILALAYAAFDESTQRFSPGRTVALDDFGANATGVLAGSLLMLLLARFAPQRR